MTSTQTIEELSAQCAAKYGITREMIDHAERWTETDGDLEGLSEERVRGILDMRFGAIAVDTPRSELWHTPDTIDVIEDMLRCYLGIDLCGGTIRKPGSAEGICSTCIYRTMRCCAAGIRCRCTSIYTAAVSLTDIRN